MAITTTKQVGEAMTTKAEWIFMPHPGHFIGSFDCRFHLNTYVNGFIVSTVGEYFPDEPVREILAETRGIKLRGFGDDRKHSYMQKIGYEDIGFDRKYETMVFKAQKGSTTCCPYVAVHDGNGELAMRGYRSADDAYQGHLALCHQAMTGKFDD